MTPAEGKAPEFSGVFLRRFFPAYFPGVFFNVFFGVFSGVFFPVFFMDGAFSFAGGVFSPGGTLASKVGLDGAGGAA